MYICVWGGGREKDTHTQRHREIGTERNSGVICRTERDMCIICNKGGTRQELRPQK